MKKLFMMGCKALSLHYLARRLIQFDKLVDRVKFLESRVDSLSQITAAYTATLADLARDSRENEAAARQALKELKS